MPFVLITRLTCASRLAVLNVARGVRLTQATAVIEGHLLEKTEKDSKTHHILIERQGCRLYIDTRFHRQMFHETRFIERTSRVHRFNANVHMVQLFLFFVFFSTCVLVRTLCAFESDIFFSHLTCK